jgi:hypothetical protein
MIALIIPYYGVLPRTLQLFFNNCGSRLIEIYFISDLDFSQYEFPPNVHIIQMPLVEIARRLEDVTGIKPCIDTPYKLCDCRPLFGKIFQDIIKDYSYWATGDCDLIYGNLDKKLLEIDYESFEMISVRKYWTTGSLNIYKNTQKINELFLRNPDLRKILTTSKGFAADESGGFWYELSHGTPLESLTAEVKTLTHLVTDSDIKWYHEDLFCEQLQGNEILAVSKDGIKSLKTQKEIFAFHYVNHKKTFIFSLPDWDKIPDRYYIDACGFFTEKICCRNILTIFNLLRLNLYLTMKQVYRLFRYQKWYPKYYL